MSISEEYYRVIIPTEPIAKSIDELKKLQASWSELHNEREQWRITPDVRVEGGFQKVQMYRDELASIDDKQRQRIAETREAIEGFRSECFEAIDAQVTPSGDDVMGENEADFALIKNNLIDRPEHLRKIVEKHNNAAFRNAARDYAQERNWDGFDYKAKENSVREYCTQMFDMFERAASVPLGLSMMQSLEEGEPVRVAIAYGVIDCLPDGGFAA